VGHGEGEVPRPGVIDLTGVEDEPPADVGLGGSDLLRLRRGVAGRGGGPPAAEGREAEREGGQRQRAEQSGHGAVLLRSREKSGGGGQGCRGVVSWTKERAMTATARHSS